jgi:hypothetical protein
MMHYAIDKKAMYIRLGSWNKGSNAQKTPADIWAAAQSNLLHVPRVSVAFVSEKLARKLGPWG